MGNGRTTPKKILDHVFNFFSDKFTTTIDEIPSFHSHRMKRITGDEASYLERPFEEVEVWNAIKNCESNKAPGPDGFTIGFVKKKLANHKRRLDCDNLGKRID